MPFFEALKTTVNTIKAVPNFKKRDFSQKKKSEIDQCENTGNRFETVFPLEYTFFSGGCTHLSANLLTVTYQTRNLAGGLA